MNPLLPSSRVIPLSLWPFWKAWTQLQCCLSQDNPGPGFSLLICSVYNPGAISTTTPVPPWPCPSAPGDSSDRKIWKEFISTPQAWASRRESWDIRVKLNRHHQVLSQDLKNKLENQTLKPRSRNSSQALWPTISRNSFAKHLQASPPSFNCFLAPAGPICTLVMSEDGVIQCLDQDWACQNGPLSTEVIPGSN